MIKNILISILLISTIVLSISSIKQSKSIKHLSDKLTTITDSIDILKVGDIFGDNVKTYMAIGMQKTDVEGFGLYTPVYIDEESYESFLNSFRIRAILSQGGEED